LKSTVPETVPLGANVTVAVSVAEPPKAMVEGETLVDIDGRQVVSAPTAKSTRVAVSEGEVRVSKRNLLTQGRLPANNLLRSIPTSKNSAVASVFGVEVLSWLDHGSVEMEPVFDLAQMLALVPTV